MSRRAEEEIRQLDLALDHAMRGVSRLDPQGRFAMVKQQYAQMLGYSPDELLGQRVIRLGHGDLPRLAREGLPDHARYRPGRGRCRARRKDGTLFYKHLLLVKTFDERGEHNGHYCLMRDITERKQAEEEKDRLAAQIRATSSTQSSRPPPTISICTTRGGLLTGALPIP